MSDNPRIIAKLVTHCGCRRTMDMSAPTETIEIGCQRGIRRTFRRSNRVISECTDDLWVFEYREESAREIDKEPDAIG